MWQSMTDSVTQTERAKKRMDIYFAPMEGITGYVFRNAHHQFYGSIAQYFTPFIAPSRSRRMTARELQDILPDHNQGINVLPQLLTNRAEDFIWAAERIREFGYTEVNLNLGCPSGTVVSKYRGSGFLALREELDRFLEEVSSSMQKMGLSFSVKTRIGKEKPEEFQELLQIFNRYPLEKLIIHPRVQTDFYKNRPNWEVFRKAEEDSRNPLCYNGDIFSGDSYRTFAETFPQVKAVMLGRGILQNPALAEEICSKKESGRSRMGIAKVRTNTEDSERQRLRCFHDAVLAGYQEAIPGDRNVLFKMKELWSYLGVRFEGGERLLKRLKKAGRMEEYKAVAGQLFEDCALTGEFL